MRSLFCCCFLFLNAALGDVLPVTPSPNVTATPTAIPAPTQVATPVPVATPSAVATAPLGATPSKNDASFPRWVIWLLTIAPVCVAVASIANVLVAFYSSRAAHAMKATASENLSIAKSMRATAVENLAIAKSMKALADENVKRAKGTVQWCIDRYLQIEEWCNANVKRGQDDLRAENEKHYHEKMWALHFAEYHLLKLSSIPADLYTVWLRLRWKGFSDGVKMFSMTQKDGWEHAKSLVLDQDFTRFIEALQQIKDEADIAALVAAEVPGEA